MAACVRASPTLSMNLFHVSRHESCFLNHVKQVKVFLLLALLAQSIEHILPYSIRNYIFKSLSYVKTKSTYVFKQSYLLSNNMKFEWVFFREVHIRIIFKQIVDHDLDHDREFNRQVQGLLQKVNLTDTHST